MFQRLAVLVLVIACGGTPPKPIPRLQHDVPAATQPSPAPAAEVTEVTAEPPPPPARAPAAPRKTPIYNRLRDGDDSIAGLDGFSITREPDQNHCGGVAIVVKRAKNVAKEDEPFAAVLALEFPTDLKFETAGKEQKEATMKRFAAFVDDMQKAAAVARTHYGDQLAKNPSAVTRVVAAARLAQIYTRLASLLARAEIPSDVRSGDHAAEKIAAYCAVLAESAEPLLTSAEDATSECSQRAKAANGGWWDSICAAR